MNIGRGEEAALKRFLSLIVDCLGLGDSAVEHAEPGHGEPGRMRCDPAKAHDLLGWKAAVGLQEGLRRQAEWWLSERMTEGERARFQQRVAAAAKS
jgi:nucleoside-diphosphate-sugar epimerase